jgi:hypothetical protein
MEESYSIDEILKAINEIQNKKGKKKTNILESNFVPKDYSAIPKDTLKLIEEAEKVEN